MPAIYFTPQKRPTLRRFFAGGQTPIAAHFEIAILAGGEPHLPRHLGRERAAAGAKTNANFGLETADSLTRIGPNGRVLGGEKALPCRAD